MKYGFIIDNRKCIGCHACTVACKAEHEVPIGVNRTWVKYIEKGTFPDSRRYFTVMRCNHCDNPPCVEICPVGALFQRDDGIVDFNNQRCIGCKSCTMACPYDSIYIDPDTGTAAKCNYCAPRVDNGLLPACVNVCPEQAIISGDLDNPQTEISRLLGRNQVTARKVEKGTVPKLFYINGEGSAMVPMAAPPTNNYQQFEQAAGVGHYAFKAAKRAIDIESEIISSRGNIPTGYQEENKSKYGVTLADGGGSRVDLMAQKATRTHDAPSKGILWGWELPAYLWSKAVAAGLFIVSSMTAIFSPYSVTDQFLWFSAITSLIFLVLTVLFLVKDLDKPMRFFYVLLRPQYGSWLARGGLIMTAFGFFVMVWIIGQLSGIDAIKNIAYIAGTASAVFLGVYTAFLLGQAKGIDFWQSPLMPYHMLAHTIMAGAATVLLYGLVSYDMNIIEISKKVLMGAIVANLVFTLSEIFSAHSTADQMLAAKIIFGKKYGNIFISLVLMGGNLLPLWLLVKAGFGLLLIPVALLVLLGIWVSDHIWIRAPQLIARS